MPVAVPVDAKEMMEKQFLENLNRIKRTDDPVHKAFYKDLNRRLSLDISGIGGDAMDEDASIKSCESWTSFQRYSDFGRDYADALGHYMDAENEETKNILRGAMSTLRDKIQNM